MKLWFNHNLCLLSNWAKLLGLIRNHKVSHSALYFGLIIYTAIGAKVREHLYKWKLFSENFIFLSPSNKHTIIYTAIGAKVRKKFSNKHITYTAIGAKVRQDVYKFFRNLILQLEKYNNNGPISDLPNSWASVWDWQIRNSPGAELNFQLDF